MDSAELPKPGTLDLLVIQPTPFCNLDCDYCYLPSRQSKARMSMETLTAILRRAFESRATGDHFTIVWHAGEPLVLPVSFYREALEMIARENSHGVKISHSIQTNATLINPGWCEFFREHDFRIGVSIDGPDFLHDRHRKTRGGQGTHPKVMRGISTLQQQGIPFHVISVITRESLDYPDELFEFYLHSGIRCIAFNVEEIEGPNLSSSLMGREMERRYRAFLRRFLDLVRASHEKFELREFDGALASLGMGGMGDRPPQQVQPLAIVSVDHQGNFSTFSPEMLGLEHERYKAGFSFGNVLRDSFDSMLENSAFRAVWRDVKSGVERCRSSCKYHKWCGGDGPVNKLFENGSFNSSETLFCRLSRKAVIDVLLDKLEADAKHSISPAV